MAVGQHQQRSRSGFLLHLADAGQSYTFDVYASGLTDPTLAVRDGAGAQLAYNDDYGSGLDLHIDFTAPHSGTYYLDVGGYSSHTGSYLLVA